MTWAELAENPKALTSLFDEVPSLSNVEILSIKMDRDGPTVDLVVAVKEYPGSPPLRWRTNREHAVAINLQLMALESFRIEGWSTENHGEITVFRNGEGKLELFAKGVDFQVRSTFGFLRIVRVSPYHLVVPGTAPR